MKAGLILASASPRRADLLEAQGIPFLPDPSSVDEDAIQADDPRELVLARAAAKARDVARRHPRDRVLGADTAVVLDDHVLGQPRDAREARAFLEALSGRTHRVMTGVCLLGPDVHVEDCVESRVAFRPLAVQDIDRYLASREWEGKAGAYAIQGRAGDFVESFEGSWTNIVGLPMERILSLLVDAGGR